MANIGYPYTYGDGEIIINRNNENNVSYEIELVNKTVDFQLDLRRIHVIQGAQVDLDL